jgi:peroxiredoxin
MAVAALWTSQAGATSTHDFELYDLLGDRLVSLARLRSTSKLVVVDFFSESCKPCKEAVPAWRRLHTQHAARGLAVVIVAVPGVETDRETSRAEIERFFRASPVPFTVVWDKYGVVAKQYKVAHKGKLLLPQAFLLSSAGSLLRKAATVPPIAAEVAKRLK